MTRQHVRWLAVGLLTLACDTHPPQGRSMKASHENGLSFEYDQRAQKIEQLPDGYALELTPANARSINQITIRVQDNEFPGAGGWSEKTIGPRGYRYIEERLDGGSGGDEYDFRVTTRIGSKWVVLVQHVQSETAPDFDLAWRVIETAELR